jgi:dihydroorotate dehydrogenase
MYALLKPLLFTLNPELAHTLSLSALNYLAPLFSQTLPRYPQKVMGINFPNPVGLAAGLDKNAAHVDALARLGFGFIEVGTVTPKAQPGQAKPRLFRLVEQKALINRMGFNNFGAEKMLENLEKCRSKGILGINIGKNASTPLENAMDDYQWLLAKVYPYADYVVINVSSPNTEGLRTLQSEEYLKTLLSGLKEQQAQLAQKNKRYVPLAVKISPDLNEAEIEVLANQLMSFEIEGVIAVNTTLSRKGIENSVFVAEKGGLSGMPLTVRSTQVIQQLYAVLGEKIPIIASGGIMSPHDALEKMKAGAKLIQLYTGLIYEGPSLIKDIILALSAPRSARMTTERRS